MQAEILINPQEATFEALLSRDGLIIDGRPVHRLHGRWIRKQGILITAVVLAQRQPAAAYDFQAVIRSASVATAKPQAPGGIEQIRPHPTEQPGVDVPRGELRIVDANQYAR